MLNPTLIGDMVLHAIQTNEFYIMSHPEYKEGIEQRAAEIGAACDRWAAFREDYSG